jgi:PIN domain nuclease of toxin-antitoxin system
MRVMLDTHAFLWFVSDEPRLSETARTLIEDPATNPFLSIASVWEMAIKVGLGKLTPHVPFPMLIAEQLNENGIALLAITVDHALRVAQLPYHHRDPFDRMLIAQAITEGLPIIGADSVFDAYSVTRIW